MSALIVLTIGPVQSYINQARRTQDLWQGSRILSYLAAAAVHLDPKDPAAEVIYPAIAADQTDNIPNRLVVRWTGLDDAASAYARKMENAIRQAWRDVSSNTMRYFTEGVNADDRERVLDIWQRQEDNWLECYWVVVPEEPQATYSENMQQANDALGARKLLRNFGQSAERGRKCSITGEHEALHGGGDVVQFWSVRRDEQRNLALLGEHERLSAIATIKRFAHEPSRNKPLHFPQRFPSTSSIAAATFRYGLLQAIADDGKNTTRLEQALRTYIDALLAMFRSPNQLFFTREGGTNPEYFGQIEATIPADVLQRELIQQFRSIDGDFLFEDTLLSKTVEEYSRDTPSQADLLRARAALADLLRAASDLGIVAPQPYLVILSMDGDHMGKTLGTLRNAEQHRGFSEALANFARKNVATIVEQDALGRVVYAGGDDVLALLPVSDALTVAERLRKAFQDAMAATGIRNHEGEPLTASTGLAYVHHTHNLQAAVEAANGAQKTAKKRFERDAVAVAFLRRSGEARHMGHKWQVEANDTPILQTVAELVGAFSGVLARQLPQDILRMTYSMATDGVPQAAREAELVRVLKRRLPEGRQAEAVTLAASIYALLKVPPLTDIEKRWENMQYWLELARFVSQTTPEPNAEGATV